MEAIEAFELKLKALKKFYFKFELKTYELQKIELRKFSAN